MSDSVLHKSTIISSFFLFFPLILPLYTYQTSYQNFKGLCNQYLSPLTLWARIQLRRGVLDTTLYNKVCQCLQLVGGFLRVLRVPPRYNWIIVEGGVKHQKPTKSKLRKFLIIFCICFVLPSNNSWTESCLPYTGRFSWGWSFLTGFIFKICFKASLLS